VHLVHIDQAKMKKDTKDFSKYTDEEWAKLSNEERYRLTGYKDFNDYADKLAQSLCDNLGRNVMRKHRIMNDYFREAIRFAIKTHEVYQKQKRKGKDIPYITHPLSVGLVLAMARANNYVIVAGILHDTIEDSISEKKVTKQMLEDRFGSHVAQIVDEVSEQDKSKPWFERKLEAIAHIKTMSLNALWVKTADTICNLSELVDDFNKDGADIFSRFNAPTPTDFLTMNQQVVHALIERWKKVEGQKDNDMICDLRTLDDDLSRLSRS